MHECGERCCETCSVRMHTQGRLLNDRGAKRARAAQARGGGSQGADPAATVPLVFLASPGSHGHRARPPAAALSAAICIQARGRRLRLGAAQRSARRLAGKAPADTDALQITAAPLPRPIGRPQLALALPTPPLTCHLAPERPIALPSCCRPIPVSAACTRAWRCARRRSRACRPGPAAGAHGPSGFLACADTQGPPAPRACRPGRPPPPTPMRPPPTAATSRCGLTPRPRRC